MRGKLSDTSEKNTVALDVRDRDAEQMEKAKIFTDDQRRRSTQKWMWETVMLQQDKVDKFTKSFDASPHKVVSKTGNQVVVESPTGVRYYRNK